MNFNSNPKTLSNVLVQYTPNGTDAASLMPAPPHPTHLQLAAPSTPTSQLFPSMLYPSSPHMPNPLRSLNLIPPSPTGSTSSVNTQLQINTNHLLQSPMGPAPPLPLSMPGTPSMMPPPPGTPHHPAAFHPHQQIFWYYPTPPVSPSTQLYMPQMFPQSYQAAPCVLVVKGAASTITINEILQFFEGYDVYSHFNYSN
jgi:hypothetical protein